MKDFEKSASRFCNAVIQDVPQYLESFGKDELLELLRESRNEHAADGEKSPIVEGYDRAIA